MKSRFTVLASSVAFTLLTIPPTYAGWETVAQPFTIKQSRQAFDRVNRQFNVIVKLTNDSEEVLEGPLRLLVDNATLQLATPSGITETNVPYVLLDTSSIAPGETVSQVLKFEFNRGRLKFNLSVQQELQDSLWELVWHDEFDGNAIDETKWSFEENCWGGGNNEQQCYTSRGDNAFVENGRLTILAKKETFTGPDNPEGNLDSQTTLPYTSARLRTIGKGDWTYGRFEISAKLPEGQGTWPAIWMLPTDWVYGGWAASGEIDIMEAVNLSTPTDEAGAESGEIERRTHGTLHYGREWPGNVYSGSSYKLPDGINPADGFHEYAVEWEQDEIRWYVDDIHFATQRSDGWYSQFQDETGQWQNGEADAPFNQRFHMLLNLAVGGSWAANTNNGGIDETAFPQTLEVDYVRVYECSVNPSNGQGCATIGDSPVIVEGHQPPVISEPEENLGAGPRFDLFTDELTEGLSYGSYNPNVSVSSSVVAEAGRGNILLIEQTGNIGNLYFNADPAINLSHYAEFGHIKLDVKRISGAADSPTLIKIDSGWPAVGDASLELPLDSEWHTMSFAVSRLIENGNRYASGYTVDMNSVVNPFVIESSAPVTLALDNIRYEYDLAGLTEAVIYDDSLHAPFTVSKYVANGSVDIAEIDVGGTHGNVHQFSFNTDESVVYFQTLPNSAGVTTKLDVSNFDTLVFDLLVTHDPREDRRFMVKMDCGHPCSSNDYPIVPPVIGEWTTYQIRLSDLVSNTGSSLDLTKVDTPLVIFPAWGNQSGVVMHVDNVKLVGDGDDTNNAPTKIMVNDALTLFDESLNTHWDLWDCCANASLAILSDDVMGNVINVDFFGPEPTVSGLSANLPHDVSAVSAGTLSFDLRLMNPPADPSTLMLLKVEATDGSSAQFPLHEGLDGEPLNVNIWQSYSFDIATLASAGLNISKLKYIMVFPEWGKATGTVYQLDNINITP
ncbi:glycoside hydrolase family 16 protein [Alteromonas sp. ASW11-130]|uniref:glycoside hydrolase family 16 protein n=1 Tax=Alteromonas sp. ASW11-130 TaxID=3015775 RepID=UPI002242A815|nr:glycoside hydrolase family 16 protein [Alteromonas sp. ASW11-130]MCW8092181.1 family 16 glycosylhydrolase [Alteromonas sp. ASW11-130]